LDWPGFMPGLFCEVCFEPDLKNNRPGQTVPIVLFEKIARLAYVSLATHKE
jgi:hypothetical protein